MGVGAMVRAWSLAELKGPMQRVACSYTTYVVKTSVTCVTIYVNCQMPLFCGSNNQIMQKNKKIKIKPSYLASV